MQHYVYWDLVKFNANIRQTFRLLQRYGNLNCVQIPKAVAKLELKIDDLTLDKLISKYRGNYSNISISEQDFALLAHEVYQILKKRQEQSYKEYKKPDEEQRLKQMRNLAGMWKQHVLFGQKEWGVHEIKITQDGDNIKGVIVKTTVQGKSLPITIGQDLFTGSINGDSVHIKFRRTTDSYACEFHLKILKKGEMEGPWTSNANQKGNSRWYMQ